MVVVHWTLNTEVSHYNMPIISKHFEQFMVDLSSKCGQNGI